jgi:nucleotide-binding universal stress UspA family protein
MICFTTKDTKFTKKALMPVVFSRSTRFSCFVFFVLFVVNLRADPLSKKTDIDFFRDVPSRNLKGLATRSDGRLVGGPTLTEVAGPAPADLLWCLEPTPDAAKWLVGTGPDGKIFEFTFNSTNATSTSREVVKLDDPQVFAVKRLADGAILAGTSPKGALYLIRDGKPVARVALPVDSIFDFLLLDERTALVATGNPGRIYRVDLGKFAAAGVVAEKITDVKILAERGIGLFAEIRDRNVRRLAVLADGRVVAGSAPKGNIYTFASATAGDAAASPRQPVILQENRDAEVTDLLPQPNGDLYAAIVFASSSGESRITPPKSGNDAKAATDVPPPAQPEKFAGRSSIVWFPANGFPETVVSRANGAFYRVLRRDDTLLMAGGEAGELFGYDIKAKLALTFAGSISSQLNGLAPIAGAPGKFLLLRNNTPGLALLDFDASGPREAETRRLDLTTPSLLGSLRFSRLKNFSDQPLNLEIRVSNGSDEVEGWSPWTPLKLTDAAAPNGAGWSAENLRGRYFKLRLRLPAAPAAPELDKGALFVLPQNRRPVLQEFRFVSPNYGILPAVDQPPPASATLSQLMSQPARDEDAKRRESFLRSQIVPAPGQQVVFWNVTDPDGDNVLSTFSIRRSDETTWTDLAVNTHESFAQFDTAHLADGVYATRIVATETSPRLAAERLSATFETDDLVVDHTAPEILEVAARRDGDRVVIAVHGRDALSLLQGIEVNFNSGLHEETEQPDDGIRDSRDERFTVNVPLAKISNATSAEVILYDAAGNSTAKRVTW